MVALPVPEAKSKWLKSVLFCESEGGGRVETPAEQDDCWSGHFASVIYIGRIAFTIPKLTDIVVPTD